MADTGQHRDEAAREPAALAAVDSAAVDEAGSVLPASSDLRPHKPIVPGDCLAGRFLIEQELGRGGAGTVFIAPFEEREAPIQSTTAGAIQSATRTVRADAKPGTYHFTVHLTANGTDYDDWDCPPIIIQ
jgi:hypothetical protein